jgi:hypothetical protein
MSINNTDYIRELLVRTIVIGLGSYILISGRLGHVTPNSLMEHTWIGFVGATGSVLSEVYVEPYSSMKLRPYVAKSTA